MPALLPRQVVLEGVGVHTGCPASVALTAGAGPIRLRAQGLEVSLGELSIASTLRATTVKAGGGSLHVGTVEHLMAALAGLSVRQGLVIAVEGPEMPLLDGGAGAWCDALVQLSLPSEEPRCRVTRSAVIEAGSSRYELAPSSGIEVHVQVDFDDPRIETRASWWGDPGDFRARIAPARTFAFAHELGVLLQNRLAHHVDPTAAVLIAPDAIHHAGRPFRADEPARHKLLDLMGDLYLFGGPPVGIVRAFRPGHAANVQALQQARKSGVLAPG